MPTIISCLIITSQLYKGMEIWRSYIIIGGENGAFSSILYIIVT